MDTDVIVIGCGPAGLQAAIHSARAKASTVVVGRLESSAAYAATMENMFGIVSGDMTSALMDGYRQAKSFGATMMDQNIISAAAEGDRFVITVESGEVIKAKAVVLATGVSRVKLNVPGEKEFYGKGVSYCASCDCNFYKGKRVVVVGSQSEAAVSAELMTKYASETSWVSKDPEVDSKLMDAAV